ncbi:MAG: hypothetical protein SVR08_03230 [Spirochaetota bacterium]|nr:hypothetical protein [Spirochaetota bacterium]
MKYSSDLYLVFLKDARIPAKGDDNKKILVEVKDASPLYKFLTFYLNPGIL